MDLEVWDTQLKTTASQVSHRCPRKRRAGPRSGVFGFACGVSEASHEIVREAAGLCTWGFPKIRVPFLGVPIIRTIVYWGLYWGPLI